MHAVQAQHMHCSDRLKTGSLKTLDFNLNFTGTLTQLFTSYRSWGEGSVNKTGVHKACRSEFRRLALM